MRNMKKPLQKTLHISIFGSETQNMMVNRAMSPHAWSDMTLHHNCIHGKKYKMALMPNCHCPLSEMFSARQQFPTGLLTHEYMRSSVTSSIESYRHFTGCKKALSKIRQSRMVLFFPQPETQNGKLHS